MALSFVNAYDVSGYAWNHFAADTVADASDKTYCTDDELMMWLTVAWCALVGTQLRSLSKRLESFLNYPRQTSPLPIAENAVY